MDKETLIKLAFKIKPLVRFNKSYETIDTDSKSYKLGKLCYIDPTNIVTKVFT